MSYYDEHTNYVPTGAWLDWHQRYYFYYVFYYVFFCLENWAVSQHNFAQPIMHIDLECRLFLFHELHVSYGYISYPPFPQ